MNQQIGTELWQKGGFGLYIHWPFCQSKCPYCDFNSHVAEKIDQQRWLAAYLLEIDRLARDTPGRVLKSIFFGGGTPSLMSPDLVQQMIARIRTHWTMANDLEITLEANPSSVEVGRFRAFHDAGVNRVSIGVQALNDPDLKLLGRLHSVDDAKQAIEIAKATFNSVSFDLIYARQNQSMDAWRQELTEALHLAEGHLSLYQLTIEDGTAFGDRFKRGRLKGLPSEDLGADMYIETQRLTEKAGFSNYEVSNYASPGRESIHNCIYWSAGDYIGIGPGAHGRLTIGGRRFATEAVSNPMLWLGNIEKELSVENRTALSNEEQAIEYLMMGIRHKNGISQALYAQLASTPFNQMDLEELTKLNMVQLDGDTLKATQRGRMVLNSVISKLLA